MNNIPLFPFTQQERLAVEGIEACQELVSETAKKWYINPATNLPIERNFGEIIALMHSELSEALEAHRKNLMDSKLYHRSGIEVEFADLIIRVFETCHKMNLDLAGAIIEKNRYNMNREDHKNENRLKTNGKAY
jgi:NTP pyrophosphatase (non-canonical NTP hydrolase)